MKEENRVVVAIPGHRSTRLSHLVLDFNGTLAQDGGLVPGVAPRLRKLGRRLRITVATADTFGKARLALKGLPLDIEIVDTGRDKLRVLKRIGPSRTMAIGNGRNDVAMMRKAALSIAVIGPEGAEARALQAADVIVSDTDSGKISRAC